MLAYAYPDLDIHVRCGKGTYIRSLARDLGHRLGCGGYISALRRLEVGCFHANEACTLELDVPTARQRLLPIELAVADLPRITLAAAEATRLLHGQWIRMPKGIDAAEAAVFDEGGRLLAVAEIAEGMLHARKAMARADRE